MKSQSSFEQGEAHGVGGVTFGKPTVNLSFTLHPSTMGQMARTVTAADGIADPKEVYALLSQEREVLNRFAEDPELALRALVDPKTLAETLDGSDLLRDLVQALAAQAPPLPPDQHGVSFGTVDFVVTDQPFEDDEEPAK